MSKHTTACGINIVFKAARIFTMTYYCEACPNEWTDEALTVTHSYCPCCDRKVEPGTIEEHEEERPEFDLEDEELDADRLREDRDDRLACLREIGGED